MFDVDIRELRFSLGLTQEQFAAQVGVTVSTVSRWERGQLPSVEHREFLKKMAKNQVRLTRR